ncbi:hypothetical protein V1389_01355 [Flavobacterium rakeshii]|uniref:hypothetical protein n=1 Tax=Flavobacterium rakeshii TaxID=1038845 RepID=UPI002E7B19F7|nr:hypothetical protein [Flavobacterium rakeshii]MEE1896963.1 hypothetical protein [Flavobacterium rakeshii]
MKLKKLHSSISAGILLTITLFLLSCETEYIDRVNEIPGDVIQVPGYTHIESFSIDGFMENEPLYAAITENEIIVLWSAYHPLPETISPTIILPEGATVSPASGTEIPFVEGTVYTVTSEAGTTKDYTLRIDIRQQEPTYTVLGSSLYQIGALQKEVNTALSGSAALDNLLLDINQTRVYFVSAEEETVQYDAEVVFMGNGDAPFTDYGIYYFLPEDMPEGFYDMRIENGQYLLINPVENSFQSEVKIPTTFSVTRYGFPTTQSQGNTFEARGALLNEVTTVEIYSNTDSATVYPIEVVAQSTYRITLKVPEDTPVGTYNRMRFYRGEQSTVTANAVTVL